LSRAARAATDRLGRREPLAEEGGAMKTVNEILQAKSHKLLSITPNASVLDALKLMAEKEVGALLVLEGDKLAGIFSERDYARKVILYGKASKDTPVSEIMTHKVVCVRPEQSVEDCMALMTDKRIRHLPVLEDQKVIGVISIGDVVKEVISEQRFVIEQLEHYIHS
jgi:CBS domain-containing protein